MRDDFTRAYFALGQLARLKPACRPVDPQATACYNPGLCVEDILAAYEVHP